MLCSVRKSNEKKKNEGMNLNWASIIGIVRCQTQCVVATIIDSIDLNRNRVFRFCGKPFVRGTQCDRRSAHVRPFKDHFNAFRVPRIDNDLTVRWRPMHVQRMQY